MASNEFPEVAKKILLKVGAAIVSEASKSPPDGAPVKSGHLRKNITMDTSKLASFQVTIGTKTTVPYAEYVHEGTGVYGKHKTPIVPKKKKALKTPYGIKKNVKGQEPNPFLDRAAEKVIYGGGIKEILEGKDVSGYIEDAIKKSLDRWKSRK
jgi:HK97 gp10 family phage protein